MKAEELISKIFRRLEDKLVLDCGGYDKTGEEIRIMIMNWRKEKKSSSNGLRGN